MSHFAKNVVKGLDVNKVNFDFVKRAVGLLGNIGFKQINSIKNFYGNNKKVKGIGIKIPGDNYGIDLFMDNGKLTIEGESMGGSLSENSYFMKEFKKAYTAVVMRETMEREGLFGEVRAEVFGSGERQHADYNLLCEGW